MGYPIIVCFVGGTAGDIVSQILDPSELTLERQRLKKAYLFASDQEKDIFLETAQYTSVPSHDFEYHRNQNHKVLGIVCRNMHDAVWAASRFKALHRPHVWKEMTAFCSADTIEAYAQMILDFGSMLANYTSNVLYLDDIIAGKAITCLSELGYQTPGEHKYKKWLTENETSNNHHQRRSQHQDRRS
jgi:hypothetical protein